MKQLTVFLSFVFLVSCTSNTIYKKPKNLIPKDSMLLLLTDMYIASSAKFSKNKNLERDVNYMFLVYENYKIDSVRFKSSNTYYTSRIEEYNEMLSEVRKRLETRREVFDKKLKERDSLDNLKGKKERDNIKEL